MSATDLSHWDGDGIDDEDEENVEFAIHTLGLLSSEIMALSKNAKDEAWVHEKLAKHEDTEVNIAIARYFWRRAQRLKELAEQVKAASEE